jgi:hypothetical protein
MTNVRHLFASALFAGVAATASFSQTPVSVKLTAEGLGLGTADVNAGGVVDADIPGKLVTSPVVGQASILTIQRSGLAGPGTIFDKLLVTVTARTHLDTTSGLPAVNDYQAGTIYISDENTSLPDGKDEGLGVRAFTVNTATALRLIDSGTGRAKQEGSKDVSGGTGPSTFTAGNANGAPHVDEDVIFDFAADANAQAAATHFLLSKFETGDKIDISVLTTTGQTRSASFQGTTNTGLFTEVSAADKLWVVNVAGVPGVLPTDLVARVIIRAIDDNPAAPAGTAEHFLITGFTTVTDYPCEPVAQVSTNVAPCGSSVTFTLGGAPGCAGCFIVSLDPGPSTFNGQTFAIGADWYPILSVVLPPSGIASVTFNMPCEFVGFTFYGIVAVVNPSFTIISSTPQVSLTIVQ